MTFLSFLYRIFAQNIYCGYTLEPPYLPITHKQCSKHRVYVLQQKNAYTCILQFSRKKMKKQTFYPCTDCKYTEQNWLFSRRGSNGLFSCALLILINFYKSTDQLIIFYERRLLSQNKVTSESP